jgi:hypothetical protein
MNVYVGTNFSGELRGNKAKYWPMSALGKKGGFLLLPCRREMRHARRQALRQWAFQNPGLGGLTPIALFEPLIFATIPLAVRTIRDDGAVILIGRDGSAGSNDAAGGGSVI